MKHKKCQNSICDNLSRRFENSFCCIECADYFNGIINLHEYILLIVKKLKI